ncbi:MAG: DUF6569 family protein [Acidobacteriota bacterium]
MEFPKAILSELTIGEPMTGDAVTIFPILGPAKADVDLVDLDEALAHGWVRVSEMSESGRVPELRVVNESPHRIILFDGEELVGAKQNRIVNVTIIVAAFSKLTIPVSCVEQGRWRWRSRHFASGEFLYPSLRRNKFAQVSQNLRRRRGFQAEQGRIWEDIAAKSARMGVLSETGSMRDLGNHYFVDDREIRKQIEHQPGQVGYLAFVRGGFAGGDVFGSSSISERKFYKLVRGYYLDSLDPETAFPPMETAGLLERIASIGVEPVESLGEGRELRFQDDGIQGSLTLVGEGMAHLAVFPAAGEETTGRPRERRFRVD